MPAVRFPDFPPLKTTLLSQPPNLWAAWASTTQPWKWSSQGGWWMSEMSKISRRKEWMGVCGCWGKWKIRLANRAISSKVKPMTRAASMETGFSRLPSGKPMLVGSMTLSLPGRIQSGSGFLEHWRWPVQGLKARKLTRFPVRVETKAGWRLAENWPGQLRPWVHQDLVWTWRQKGRRWVHLREIYHEGPEGFKDRCSKGGVWCFCRLQREVWTLRRHFPSMVIWQLLDLEKSWQAGAH